MFGYDISAIAEGWTKDIIKAELELHDSRLAICRLCPLFTAESPFGPICDSKKCWDKINMKLVLYPGKEIKCGCGCYLDKKTRVKSAKCVLEKW